MKQIIIVMMGWLMLASCEPKKFGGFVVNGKVENAPMPLMYLEHLPFENNGKPLVIDSVTLPESGAFELRGIATEEGLYALTFNHQAAIIFVNDNGHITINFDINNFRNPSITNSDGTKALYAFINDFRAKDSALAYTYYHIDSLRTIPGMDSAGKALQSVGLQQLSALNEIIKKFIQESTHPAAIFFAQDKAKDFMEPEVLNKIAIESSDKFKEHSGLAIFKSMMAQLVASKTGNAASETYPMLNQQAPDLTMNDVNGKPISISSFSGKYVLVDFWASWCGPCRGENPNVVKAYNKFKDKNFTILGVSLDDDKTAWIKAIKQDGLSWVQMSDLKKWQSEAVNKYQINGIPFNVLLDPQGKIIASNLRGEGLENKLAALLK